MDLINIWRFTMRLNICNLQRHSSLTPIWMYKYWMTFDVVSAKTSSLHFDVGCSTKQKSLNFACCYDAVGYSDLVVCVWEVSSCLLKSCRMRCVPLWHCSCPNGQYYHGRGQTCVDFLKIRSCLASFGLVCQERTISFHFIFLKAILQDLLISAPSIMHFT